MKKLSYFRIALLTAMLLLLCLQAVAQIQLTDKLNVSSSGNLSAGYSAGYGNMTPSSHSFGWGGNAAFDGYYYNPQFLSFSAQPYYDQSRANSGFQSIADSSGVNFNSSIFSGSRFPGTVSYTKSYNSLGNFAVPGLADYTTHGNNDSFGVGWAANLQNLPSVSTQFQMGSSDYSIYGTDAQGHSNFENFLVRSTYQTAGFNLNGGYSHSNSDGEVPLLLTGEGTETTSSNSDVYNFNASHRLPFKGSFTGSFSHLASDYSFSQGSTSGNYAVNTVNGSAGFHPWTKVSFSSAVSYDDNLGGSLTQGLLGTTAAAPTVIAQPGSQSLSLSGEVGYQATTELGIYGQVQRREQTWNSVDVGMNSYSGIVRYARKLWGGYLGASMSVAGSQEDNRPGMVFSFTDSLSYSREFGNWMVGGSFGYSQNAQTLLVTYLSSNYNAGLNARRRIGSLFWNVSASTSRTGLTIVPGDNASSESFSTGLSAGKWISLAATYQTSTGTAVQTGAGLVSNPLLNPLLSPNLLVLYGGNSYSFSASSNFVKRFAVAAAYSHATSNTVGGLINSYNGLEQLQFSTHYQFRQMYLTGGYTRFTQGVGASGLAPSQLSSFYVGVYRWFKFF